MAPLSRIPILLSLCVVLGMVESLVQPLWSFCPFWRSGGQTRFSNSRGLGAQVFPQAVQLLIRVIPLFGNITF